MAFLNQKFDAKGLARPAIALLATIGVVLVSSCASPTPTQPYAGGTQLYVPPDAGTDAGNDNNGEDGASNNGVDGAAGNGVDGAGGNAGDDGANGGDNDSTANAGDDTGGNGTSGDDTSGGSSGGADDAGSTGVEDSGSTTEQDAGGTTVEDTSTTVQDSYTPPEEDTVTDTYTPPFGGDVPLGSSEDAKPYDSGIDYSDITDTGVTGTIPGLCTPKIAQYNIEDKKTGGKVDVIFFIDTSGSMSAEAKSVNKNLNSFASFIAAKNLDYRIVLVGKTTSCCPVSPTLGNWLQPGTFMHIKKVIYSTDGLKKLTDGGYINDFKAFLRPDASKNWVAVTDDDSLQQKWADFDKKIMAIKHPSNPAGAPLFKNYLFHSIVAWGPLAFKGCNTGARIGKEYLALTAKTGGVKAKVCDQNWTPIFQDIAKGVIKSAKPGCTYPIAFYKGEFKTKGFDLSYIAADDEYKIKAAKNNSCPANGQGFIYDVWPNPKKITICPTSCQQLKGGGNLVFNHGCI